MNFSVLPHAIYELLEFIYRNLKTKQLLTIPKEIQSILVLHLFWDRRTGRGQHNPGNDHLKNLDDLHRGMPRLDRNVSRHWHRDVLPSCDHRSETYSLQEKKSPVEKQPWAFLLASAFLHFSKELRVKKHSYWSCSNPLPINNILQSISVTTNPVPTEGEVMQEVRSVSPRPTEFFGRAGPHSCHATSIPLMRPQALCKGVQ